ncbi:MAG: alcohol dehydrogenase catalytic domain-containing protein, partial [Sulfolobaceae archaeon]
MKVKAMRLVEIGKPLIPMQVELPNPKGYEVLVRVKAVGVCRSDFHFRSGYIGKFNILTDLNIKLPLTLGHEISGVIEDFGDKVPSIFKKGDKVVIYPWQGDGVCKYCRIGEEHLCDNFRHLGINTDGGYSEYILVPNYKYLYRFDRVDFTQIAPIA